MKSYRCQRVLYPVQSTRLQIVMRDRVGLRKDGLTRLQLMTADIVAAELFLSFLTYFARLFT